jgi:hypothetical protein
VEDVAKIAFRCPGHIGLFELIVMTFGLKNAGATYQRAMNYIFHELIGKIVEIYIDDVVIKSLDHESHWDDVKKTLECTRKHVLKMNTNKCAYGVSAGEFLGFLVHEGGIEVGKKSTKAIDEVVPPTNLKELQSLLGKINFMRRFISNLSQKVLPFSPLLRIKKDQKFVWGDEQQKAFNEIKEYMKEPLVLAPLQLNKPFKLYVAADTQTIGSALIKEFEGKERVVAYLSQIFLIPKQDIRLQRSFACVFITHVQSFGTIC